LHRPCSNDMDPSGAASANDRAQVYRAASMATSVLA
jgi:hypothetical protein